MAEETHESRMKELLSAIEAKVDPSSEVADLAAAVRELNARVARFEKDKAVEVVKLFPVDARK